METKQLPDLSSFTGTESYHRLSILSRLVFTDGWTHLAESVGCFWLADIVASVQHKPKVRANNSFLVWRIQVKNSEAVVEAFTDSEDDGSFSKTKRVYVQKVPYTDFPEGTFEWYQVGQVVMLKGEY